MVEGKEKRRRVKNDIETGKRKKRERERKADWKKGEKCGVEREKERPKKTENGKKLREKRCC